MWFVAHQVAPAGREIRFTRAIVAVILIACFSEAAEHWLRPLVGYWTYALEFAASMILVMVFLQLTFWRSLLAVVIYWAVIVGGIIFVMVVTKQHAEIKNVHQRIIALHRSEFIRVPFRSTPGHAPVADSHG